MKFFLLLKKYFRFWPRSLQHPAERSFSALRRFKTYLRSTMGQKWLNSIALINVERAYANSTLKNNMEKIIDIFEQRRNSKSYFF
jgi:hypothetical protein